MKPIRIITAFLLLLAGCSVVFDASISGTVIDHEDNDVEGWIYLYDSAGSRDSDYNDSGNISRYFLKQKLDGGDFRFNKFIWETKDSSFGRTGDRRKVYFLIVDESNDDPAYYRFSEFIVSGVSNRITLQIPEPQG